jgi:hypothetical protein
MRALKIRRDRDPPQAPEADAMRRWTERQREQQLAARLDRLCAALERLCDVIERRAA